jgi:hypothetical protein
VFLVAGKLTVTGFTTMDMEDKVALLKKFLAAHIATGCRALDIGDAIRLGIPEEPHVAKMLEQFVIAADCARLVAEMNRKDVPEGRQAAAK